MIDYENIESGIICDKCKKPIYKGDTYYILDYPRWISYNDVCEDCIDDVMEYITSQIMVESAKIA